MAVADRDQCFKGEPFGVAKHINALELMASTSFGVAKHINALELMASTLKYSIFFHSTMTLCLLHRIV